MSQKTKEKEQKTSDTDRYVGRRRFLAATGAVAGTGVLAGCLDGEEEPVDDDDDDEEEPVDAMSAAVAPRLR